MQIIVGKTAGFCFGVQNAIDKASIIAEKEKEIYCLGEIVHNKEVNKKLEEKGIKFINNIEEGKNKVIIRAHGIKKEIYDKAKKINIELVDLTCPKVLKIHKVAEEYANMGCFIFLTGKKEHPETIGTISYCGKNLCIIEKKEDVEAAIQKFKESKIQKLLIISQTTFNLNVFEEIIEDIKIKVFKEVEININNTICSATKLRQEETIKIAKEVDNMLIIGGKNSSNTMELFNISKNFCRSFFVENKEDLNITNIKKSEKIGIMAGASTPKESIEKIIEILKDIC